MGHIESWFDETISSLWRRHTSGQHIADDSDSTYVVVMFALCGGDDIVDDDDLGGELPRWYVIKDDNDFRWRGM